MELGLKIWVSSKSGDDIMGTGRWSLLKAINEEGSLMAASLKLGVSYRKAWGLIRKAEEDMGFQLVRKVRGGSKGGETTLTEEGKSLIKAYEVFYMQVSRDAEKAFRKFKGELKRK